MTTFSRRRLLDIAGSVTAASVLSALRPVRVAQAAEEKSTWNVKGLFMEACNCEAMCPCVVGVEWFSRALGALLCLAAVVVFGVGAH